ncbi:TetR family transcriptional regulator [Streptomyces sp. NPDC048295]|uniref:TetR/AcrR family transcriptional regulator n=1 Tax=Streptomyces sp. NPDC048295 TaxID=3154617 RepID=UPI00342FA17F
MAGADTPRPTLIERRRETTRLDIAEAAADLFIRRGYDATTVDEIARAAGISLRTFYRHCPAKEDALTPLLTGGVVGLVDHLERQPSDVPLPAAVQEAFIASAEGLRPSGPARTRELIRVMGGVPEIRMRWLAAARSMQDRLAPVLAARGGPAADSLEARLLAAVVIDAITVALEYWAEHDSPDDVTDVSARTLALLRLEDR